MAHYEGYSDYRESFGSRPTGATRHLRETVALPAPAAQSAPLSVYKALCDDLSLSRANGGVGRGQALARA